MNDDAEAIGETSVFEQWFTDSESETQDARKEAERAQDYFHGHQLTAEEVSELKKRGQPPVVTNRVRRKIEWLAGLEIKQRTDPKAFPRNPNHQEDAEAVTDAIRYVCDDQDWDADRSEVYTDMLVNGFGGVEVVHKQTARGEVDVVINRYPWDRLFYDKHSRQGDFSDARHKGVVLWMDYEDFKQMHPDHADGLGHLAAASSTTSDSETYDDKPHDTWIDSSRKRVRVVLMWYRKGVDWHWVKFIKGTVLERGESPYKGEDGESVCPLVMQSAYVDRNNARYGIVRDMFDPQDEVNKRRSKALHLINSRQTMSIEGAVNSVAKLKDELAKPDGHVEISREAYEDAARAGARPFEILQTGDLAAAQFQLLQEAKAEIDMMGANSALEGETGESTSGRAVLARQQGGMIELAAMSDKLHRFTREVYREIWLRIRQFWTEERWIRVTDEETNARFVGLNRPITLQEQLGQMPQEQAAAIARQMGLAPGDPRLQAVVGIAAPVAEIDVDIVIEEVPDRVTLAGESYEALLQYAQVAQIPPAVLIEANPSITAKTKEKLLEMLQQPPAPSPSDQLEMAGKEAAVMETQAKTQKLQAEARAQMPLAGIA